MAKQVKNGAGGSQGTNWLIKLLGAGGSPGANQLLIKLLIGVLAVNVVLIPVVLLRSPSGSDDPVVLDPDYPTISQEPNARPIESDATEARPTVSGGGGSVTISFMDNITYNPATGQLSLFYQNPGVSTHNVVVQVILVRGEKEYLLSQSGILAPGYQVTSLQADDGAPQLSPGGYGGKLRLLFYDPETGERSIVDTDIPCTVTVVE